MPEHPIEGMMDTTLEKIKQMADVNSIIGDPITSPDGSTVIIPVSTVKYGFVSGGSDLPNKSDKQIFGGGTGASVTISPTAFLTICSGNVKMLRIDPGSTSIDRIIDLTPDLIEKISGMIKNKNGKVQDKAKSTETKSCEDKDK